MSRAIKFANMVRDTKYAHLFDQLSREDMKLIITTIDDFSYLSKDKFIGLISTLILPGPNQPENWEVILKILKTCNE